MADRAVIPALAASGCDAAAGVPATEDTVSSTRIPGAAEDVLGRADNGHAAVSRIATTDAGLRMVRGLFQRLPRLISQWILRRISLRTSLCISQRASQSASRHISRCTSDGTAPDAPLHAARSAAPGASPGTSQYASLFTSSGTCRFNPRGMQQRPASPFPGIKPPGALTRAAARMVRPPAFRRGHSRAPSPVLRPVIWPAYLTAARHMIRPLAASLLLSAGLALSFGSTASAGALERACNASEQQGGNRNLCGCIQQVADLTLNGREQKLAAGFFKDPQKAQVMRQSARRRDETFWQKYLAFGESAALYCS